MFPRPGSHQRAAATAAYRGSADEIIPVRLPDGGTRTVDETVRPSTTAEGLAWPKLGGRHRGLRRALPRDHLAGHPRKLLAAHRRSLGRADHERAEGGRARPAAAVLFHAFAVPGSDPLPEADRRHPRTQKVLRRSGLSIDAIDAYEVNEGVPLVPLARAQEFGADQNKLNPRGGAIALGHPLGGSGTKLMATLLNYLEATGGRYGLQTMCEGGGMANATIIERLSTEQINTQKSQRQHRYRTDPADYLPSTRLRRPGRRVGGLTSDRRPSTRARTGKRPGARRQRDAERHRQPGPRRHPARRAGHRARHRRPDQPSDAGVPRGLRAGHLHYDRCPHR